jgi:hypothetical protein
MGKYDRFMDKNGTDSKRKISTHIVFVDETVMFIEKIIFSQSVDFPLFHKI